MSCVAFRCLPLERKRSISNVVIEKLLYIIKCHGLVPNQRPIYINFHLSYVNVEENPPSNTSVKYFHHLLTPTTMRGDKGNSIFSSDFIRGTYDFMAPLDLAANREERFSNNLLGKNS